MTKCRDFHVVFQVYCQRLIFTDPPSLHYTPVPTPDLNRHMAFFGLTALGAQNPFSAQAKSYAILNIFSEEEFKEGFDGVDKHGTGIIKISDVEKVLEIVYHGPAPEPEIALFLKKLGAEREEPVSWEEFASVYKELCEDIKKNELEETSKIGSAANYQSFDDLQVATKRHLRTEKGPKDTLTAPLTAVQEVGWNAHEFIEKKTVHGKKSCPETIYASELVKSGVFF